jgi:hypothetical protein
MKKLLPCAVGMSLLFLACKKNDTPSLASNVWQFDDSVYRITKTYSNSVSDTAFYVNGETNLPGARTGRLVVTFRGYPQSGDYKVVTSYPADKNSVNIDIQIGGQYYFASGADGKPLHASVSSQSIHLTATDIIVQNNNNSNDRTLISLNLAD